MLRSLTAFLLSTAVIVGLPPLLLLPLTAIIAIPSTCLFSTVGVNLVVAIVSLNARLTLLREYTTYNVLLTTYRKA